VALTWPGGPVAACDALGRLSFSDSRTGAAVSHAETEAFSDGAWHFVDLGPRAYHPPSRAAPRNPEARPPANWCLVSHRGRDVVAYDPGSATCVELATLPGHVETISGIVVDALDYWGPAKPLQVRVVSVTTGGIAMVWAPTAADGDRRAPGGFYELAMPVGRDDPASETHPDYSGAAAQRVFVGCINAKKDRRQCVQRQTHRRISQRGGTFVLKRHVDVVGAATAVTEDGQHVIACWSKRRVGIWRDDRKNRERLVYPLVAVVDFNAYTVIENCVVDGQYLYVLTRHGWVHAVCLDQFVDIPPLPAVPTKIDAAAWGPAKAAAKMERKVSNARARLSVRGRQSIVKRPTVAPSEEVVDDRRQTASGIDSLVKFQLDRRETAASHAQRTYEAKRSTTRRSIRPGRDFTIVRRQSSVPAMGTPANYAAGRHAQTNSLVNASSLRSLGPEGAGDARASAQLNGSRAPPPAYLPAGA